MTLTQNEIYIIIAFSILLSLGTFLIGWTTGVKYGRFKEKHKIK